MPAAATARAKTVSAHALPALSRRAALAILNAMPMLVACSNTQLQPNAIVTVAYEVHSFGFAPYIFPAQPFCILREITFAEFRRALPAGTRAMAWQSKKFYQICTD